MDAELVLGAKQKLESYGLSVYVDWIDDPLMDRTSVTPATADTLRRRMRSAQMLIYAHTENSAVSRWCPWELGYFDGLRGGNVFLLPISAQGAITYTGQEYLGLYPYLDHVGSSIYVNRSAGGIKSLREAKTEIIRPQ